VRFATRLFTVLFATCLVALAVVRDWGRDRLVLLRPVLRTALVLDRLVT
jgi:hypothetical protein